MTHSTMRAPEAAVFFSKSLIWAMSKILVMPLDFRSVTVLYPFNDGAYTQAEEPDEDLLPPLLLSS